jgi:hypothetical protein
MPLEKNIPQNGKETAYVSFALVETLIEALVTKGILDRNDAIGVLRDAMTRVRHGKILVEHSTEGPQARAADFIRHGMLGE